MFYQWVDVNEGWGRYILDEVLENAEVVLSNGGVVVVHCNAGKHRTGAFCALLMASQRIHEWHGEFLLMCQGVVMPHIDARTFAKPSWIQLK